MSVAGCDGAPRKLPSPHRHNRPGHASLNTGDSKIGAAKMNANRSSEPRFNIVIWKGAKQLGTLRDRDASRARSNFGGVVARYKNSSDNHQVELYDGADLIETWSSEDGHTSAQTPVPANGKIHCEGERVGRVISIPCQLVPSRSAKA